MQATNGNIDGRRVGNRGAPGVRQGVIGSGGRNVIRRSAWLAASIVAVLAAVPVAAQTTDPAGLARAKKCMNCHALDQKLVGPGFKAVATRYAADKEAEDRLTKKIRQGGVGAWGVVPMPSNDVSDAEARELARWVLMQK